MDLSSNARHRRKGKPDEVASAFETRFAFSRFDAAPAKVSSHLAGIPAATAEASAVDVGGGAGGVEAAAVEATLGRQRRLSEDASCQPPCSISYTKPGGYCENKASAAILSGQRSECLSQCCPPSAPLPPSPSSSEPSPPPPPPPAPPWCFAGVATSGTLAYPSDAVVSSLDYVNALDIDISRRAP